MKHESLKKVVITAVSIIILSGGSHKQVEVDPINLSTETKANNQLSDKENN